MKTFTAFVVAALAVTSAQASLDYTYTGPGLADGSGQIDITYPTDYIGGSHTEAGIYVGQLDMSNPLNGQTFNAFCLSPGGHLSVGTAAYNAITLESAKFGLNPPSWSVTGGIENASYIWAQDNQTITTNAQGAALNLAMWAALYNSTAVGTTTGSGLFSISGAGFSPEIQSVYAADLAQLNAASPSAILSNFSQNTGYILRPVDASMQDLIVLPSAIPADVRNQLVAAPEPSTVFGLALLGLLVFGQALVEKLKLPALAKIKAQ